MGTAVADKLEKKLNQALGRAIHDFDLIEEGDRILVAVSGGKDSLVLLHLLKELRRRAPVRFDLLAWHLDQGQPGFPVELVEETLRRFEVPFEIERQDTYSIVKETLEPGKTTCSLCSRLRRGILYNAAPRLGCNKIALGHHRDDSIETFLLNLFFSGQIKAMPAKLRSDDGRNVVIRPLSYAAEDDILAYAEAMGFPRVPCKLCDEQPDLQRRRVGELLSELERDFPHVRAAILKATTDVRPSQLLDKKLFDFVTLTSRVQKAPAAGRGRELPVIAP